MARQFTKGLDLMRHQQRRFAAMSATAKAGHRDIAQQGFGDHKELTAGGNGPQGPTRKGWLRKMGHPFGRGTQGSRHLPGAVNLLKRGSNVKGAAARASVRNLPIGKISNRLHGGMTMRRVSGGAQSFGVSSRAPHAKYILSPHGTKKMVGRGFGGIQGQNGPRTGETVRRWRARNKAFVQHFIRKQRTF